MNSICVVTDNSAQFVNSSFQGRQLTRIVPLKISLNHRILSKNEKFNVKDLPERVDSNLAPQVLAPSTEDFKKLFTKLGETYNEVLGIFLSSSLNPCISNAQKAADSLIGGPKIQIIDSQTTSFGLGLLVQTAADAAIKGASVIEIERKLRSLIHRMYAVFCTPSLSYLNSNGFLDYAQATIGEMLNIYPIFTIEEGRLNPTEKLRNKRNMIAFFQEYLDEFEKLKYIAILQSAPQIFQDTRCIREHVRDKFPNAIFSEHAINQTLSVLLGPQTIGLFAIEEEITI